MDAVEIGKRVRHFREKKGFSQNHLAELAGISSTYIYQIESGKKCPTVEYIDFICTALGVSLSDFFSDVPPMPSAIDTDKISRLSPKQKRLLNDFLNSL